MLSYKNPFKYIIKSYTRCPLSRRSLWLLGGLPVINFCIKTLYFPWKLNPRVHNHLENYCVHGNIVTVFLSLFIFWIWVCYIMDEKRSVNY